MGSPSGKLLPNNSSAPSKAKHKKTREANRFVTSELLHLYLQIKTCMYSSALSTYIKDCETETRRREEKGGTLSQFQASNHKMEYDKFADIFFFSSRTIEVLALLGLISFVVLLSLKISSSLIISWPFVFLPLYIILGLTTLYLIKFEVFNLQHHDDLEWDDDFKFLTGASVCSLPLFSYN